MWDKKLLSAEEFEYDKEGHPIEKRVYDANNCLLYTLFWEYDAHGNVLLETNALGERIKRSYDANDNLISEKGPSPKFHLKNEYDHSNRLTKQKKVADDGQVFVTKYEYNYTHQRTKKIDLFGNETLYEYDDFGRLIRTQFPSVANENGEIVSHIASQEYNIAGHLIKSVDSQGRVIKKELNIRGQPIKIIYPDKTCEMFTYRLDGKLKSKTEKNGSKTIYTIDPIGRMTEENFYSPQGELLKTTTHEYDSFHLLKTVDPEGVNNSLTKSV